MSVQLLDKTRKINKLLHNNNSSKVVFNDICEVLTEILNSNILVISKKGKVLGVSLCEGVEEIKELIDFYEEVPEYDTQMYCHKKMKTTEETSLNLLKEVLPLLEAQDDYSNDALFEALVAFGKEHGYKTGYIMWPIRTALSGKQTTPAGATEILEILGKEESIKRIHAAIEKLEK